MKLFVLPADKVGAEAPVTLPPLAGVFVPGVPVELTDEQVELVRKHEIPLVAVPEKKQPRKQEQGGEE